VGEVVVAAYQVVPSCSRTVRPVVSGVSNSRCSAGAGRRTAVRATDGCRRPWASTESDYLMTGTTARRVKALVSRKRQPRRI
jgi:hypothetical protein